MHFVTLPDAHSDTAAAFSDPASLHRWLKTLPQTQPPLLLNSLREQVHAVDASLAPPGEVIALLDGLQYDRLVGVGSLSAAPAGTTSQTQRPTGEQPRQSARQARVQHDGAISALTTAGERIQHHGGR